MYMEMLRYWSIYTTYYIELVCPDFIARNIFGYAWGKAFWTMINENLVPEFLQSFYYILRKRISWLQINPTHFLVW